MDQSIVPPIPVDPDRNYTKNQGDELSAIAWHPAFVQAIQLELEDYQGVLEFYPE